jgi:hypothetical protein
MIPDDLKMKHPLAFFPDEQESTIGFTSSAAVRSQLLFRWLRFAGMEGLDEIKGKW